MTKIDFHILPTDDAPSTYHYVARLTNKAVGRDHRVLIAVESNEQIEPVSHALWSVQPDAFLAHTVIGEAPSLIQISANGQCGEHHDILINLCAETPAYFSRFERVFEVVCQEPVQLQASRDRYRRYNDNGYPIERFDLRQRSAQ